MVVERSVAARCGLQPIVEVEDNLVQWEFVGQQDAVRAEVLELLLLAAFFLQQLQDLAERVLKGNHRGFNDRLLDRIEEIVAEDRSD